MSRHLAAAGVDGMSVLILNDGSRVHLDDITTLEQAIGCLNDLDAAIDRIQCQLSGFHDVGEKARMPQWRSYATTALRVKKGIRPRLVTLIADLRWEKRAAVATRAEAKRIAFINAAEEVLEHEVFTEIWVHAQEMRPEAFVETVTLEAAQ